MMILQQLGAKQDRLELEAGRRPSASGWPAGREPRRLAIHLGQGGLRAGWRAAAEEATSVQAAAGRQQLGWLRLWP